MGTRHAPLLGPISSISVTVFGKKFGQIIVRRPYFWGWYPRPGNPGSATRFATCLRWKQEYWPKICPPFLWDSNSPSFDVSSAWVNIWFDFHAACPKTGFIIEILSSSLTQFHKKMIFPRVPCREYFLNLMTQQLSLNATKTYTTTEILGAWHSDPFNIRTYKFQNLSFSIQSN